MKLDRNSTTVLCLVAACLGSATAFSSPQVYSSNRRQSAALKPSRQPLSLPPPIHSTQQSHLFSNTQAVSRGASRNLRQKLGRWIQSTRRRCAVVCVSLLFAFTVLTARPTVAQASAATGSSSSEPLVERIIQRTSPSLDKLVDDYVRGNMFNDDTYDPLEATFREAYEDATQGAYPKALREVTGATAVAGEGGNFISNLLGNMDLGSILTTGIKFIQSKLGVSEQSAIFVLTGILAVAAPSSFLFTGMIIGGISKRNMNRVMKQRYGDSYTVDASIKQEEIVEAPDDEEDEDVEDDDGDEEDDEDDGEEKS